MGKTQTTPKTKPYALKNYKGTRNVLGGSGEYWNKIAQQSEAKYKAMKKSEDKFVKTLIQPLPDYDTTFDGWRER